MANKRKIINDPVYGFINIKHDIVFDLIEHPWFQRLRRIKQLALTHYVYPGALHTRFHHALGALHLTTQAVDILRAKGTEITDEEAEAVSIAILLHDIGHGPYSHALEHTLMNIHHETLSLLFMQKLNEEMGGRLDMAIQIFKDEYPKSFLNQLVSGQLDMDRMDYLSRDSYFTGVSEGVIGYHRIIKMLAVADGQLCVEEKGIYSVERFLTARRLMYWQVYLHKTTLVAEQMLIKVLQRAKQLVQSGELTVPSSSLTYFMKHDLGNADLPTKGDSIIQHYAALDDTDIVITLKFFTHCSDPLLRFLSKGLLNRKLFRIELQNNPFDATYKAKLLEQISNTFSRELNIPASELFLEGKESSTLYSFNDREIGLLKKNGDVVPMSNLGLLNNVTQMTTKYYLCYPKQAVFKF